MGQQYLRFAKDEPNLYKYLFLTPPDGVRGGVMEGLKLSQDLARESLMSIYNMDADTADKYFRDLWLVAYGFTTMIAIGECPYNVEQISAILQSSVFQFARHIRKSPGSLAVGLIKMQFLKNSSRKGKKIMILKTERLILRPWEESDSETLYKYASNDWNRNYEKELMLK